MSVGLIAAVVASSDRTRADTGMCGGASITLPFTDVPSSNIFFCSIAEAFFAGLTNGTGATTYSPSQSCLESKWLLSLLTQWINQ